MAQLAESLGADAVIGVDLDYEVLGRAGSMLMVTAAGTAVKLTSLKVGFVNSPGVVRAVC